MDLRIRSKVLAWRPKVSFEEGVRIMLDNIDYWKQVPVWDQHSIFEATLDWFTYLGPKEPTKK